MKYKFFQYSTYFLGAILLGSSYLIYNLTVFYNQNRPSKFDEKQLDTAISVYRFIHPSDYFEDSITPIFLVNHHMVDSTIKRLLIEKKINSLLRSTLYSLNVIDWTKNETFTYDYSTSDTLILIVNCKVLDPNNLLKNSSNKENFKLFFIPNPNEKNFEITVQNTLIFQYLIQNKPTYRNKNYLLYFTLENNKMKFDKLLININL